VRIGDTPAPNHLTNPAIVTLSGIPSDYHLMDFPTNSPAGRYVVLEHNNEDCFHFFEIRIYEKGYGICRACFTHLNVLLKLICRNRLPRENLEHEWQR